MLRLESTLNFEMFAKAIKAKCIAERERMFG
jgi:hypothetical protein